MCIVLKRYIDTVFVGGMIAADAARAVGVQRIAASVAVRSCLHGLGFAQVAAGWKILEEGLSEHVEST